MKWYYQQGRVRGFYGLSSKEHQFRQLPMGEKAFVEYKESSRGAPGAK